MARLSSPAFFLLALVPFLSFYLWDRVLPHTRYLSWLRTHPVTSVPQDTFLFVFHKKTDKKYFGINLILENPLNDENADAKPAPNLNISDVHSYPYSVRCHRKVNIVVANSSIYGVPA